MSQPLAFTVAHGTTGTTRRHQKPICLHLHSKHVASIALLITATPKAADTDIQLAFTDGVPSNTIATG